MVKVGSILKIKLRNMKKETTKQLKQEYRELYDLIYGINACYGSHDILRLKDIEIELEKRGVEIQLKVDFN